MITLTIKLKNGETREVQAYGYGVLAVHKSILAYEKGLWQLTHKPTTGTLATAKTKRQLIEIAKRVNAYAEEHLIQWESDDPSRIWRGKNFHDHDTHREAIRKICGRA